MEFKTSIILRNLWTMLSEVPGWADAPLSARLNRTLPIVLPCLGALALLIWNLSWNLPQARDRQLALAPLVALENEVDALQLASSDQQTAELNETLTRVAQQLLSTPQAVTTYLHTLKNEAASRGWNVTFNPGEFPSEPATPGGQTAYIPVRGRFVPTAGNQAVFNSFLATLERFSSGGKRFDLIRTAIRADQTGWRSVEINFRLMCPLAHAKTP